MARKEKELHMQLHPGWSARDNYATHTKKKKKKPKRDVIPLQQQQQQPVPHADDIGLQPLRVKDDPGQLTSVVSVYYDCRGKAAAWCFSYCLSVLVLSFCRTLMLSAHS